MNQNGLLFVTESAQREEAMSWLMRLSDDDVNETVVSDWMAWYQASEGNKHAFDTLQEFCERCDELYDDPIRARRLQAMAHPEPKKVIVRSWMGHLIDRVQGALVRPPWFAIGALSAACLMAMVIGVTRFIGSSEGPSVAEVESQPLQMIHETMLPDGSKVELAPRSAIEVSYTDSTRLLQLNSGEGYFSVAPNKQRPFVVHVGDLNVRAVGTEFNVRRTDGRVVVTVTKGIVDVYPGAAEQASADMTRPGPGAVRVSEGNEVTWVTDSKAPMVASIDARHAATWRQGRLEYIQEPLSSVVADVNRYSARQIVIADKELGKMNFTGTVLTDGTDEWLHSLPTVFPVKIASDKQRDTLELRTHDSQPSMR